MALELKEYLKKRKLETRHVFQSKTGGHVSQRNFVQRMFEGDLKRWGGKSIRFHDLRHTAITLMISQGIDIKTVKEIAGHHDIETTMRYVHLLEDAVQKVAKNFRILPKPREVLKNHQT